MGFGQRFRNCLQAGMLFLLILLGLQASFFLAQTSETVAAAERELWRQSDEAARTQEAARAAMRSLVLEVELLRRSAEDEMALARIAAESEVAMAREMLHGHIDAALQLGDARLAETNRILYLTAQAGIETLDQAAGDFAELTDTAERLSSETIRLERQVGAEIADLKAEFLDCGDQIRGGVNVSCLQNQINSTLGAMRRMSERLETSVPLIAERAAEKLEWEPAGILRLFFRRQKEK